MSLHEPVLEEVLIGSLSITGCVCGAEVFSDDEFENHLDIENGTP